MYQKGIQAIGLSAFQFADHSFRIGAATAGASAGIEDSMIRTLEQWSSSALLLCICILTDSNWLAGFSRTWQQDSKLHVSIYIYKLS